MSRFYDEDDMDTQEDPLEFQDEAELDDYLNDEEYDLMNELFPRAKAELSEHQGWDNLAVKQAIWDAEFDLEAALVQLKRRYKKKGLSALASLASARVAARPVRAAAGTNGASLLDGLRAKGLSSGASKLQMKRPALRAVDATPAPGASLMQTLSSLRKQSAAATPEAKPVAARPARTEARQDQWMALGALLRRQPSFKPAARPALQLSSVLLSRQTGCAEPRKTQLKRRVEEVFSVFYPNNYKAAKKQASANFMKPSPDDVVLESQKRAFEIKQVAEKVADLKFNNKDAAPKNYEDEEEDSRPKEGEQPSAKKVVQPTNPRNPIDIPAYVREKKPHMSFVVLGHVDAGKSTLMGRLLYDVGAVDTKLIRQLKRESELAGKGSFHLAWVMDQTNEERARGVTVDICTSEFETAKSTFTVIDAPGHRDFVPNAVTGVNLADVAIVTIDCATDAFESGFNLDGQTREHIILARSLGVKHIILAMNKMDTVEWHEGRFKAIRLELLSFLEDIGFKEPQTSWVPCSGLTGEGVYQKGYPPSQNWYKGPSLVDELERVSVSFFGLDGQQVSETPFLFSLLDTHSSGKNNEVYVSGKVLGGSVQPGETITIYPSEQTVVVDNIYVGDKRNPVGAAVQNDFVTLKLKNANFEDIKGGDLAAIVGFDIPSRKTFTSQVLTFKVDKPVLPGASFILFRGGAQCSARIKSLHQAVDKQDPSKVLKKKVRHIGSNQSAIVTIELTDRGLKMPLLTFDQNKRFGRILLRRDGKTIAAGVVKSIDAS
ncbi:FADR221Cp [Eremothecium gossypii FDAG1]|nr:FADR221Cp [Eremothecium gossypii FDAG1]